ncbi:MAG: M15 family metallopeptidase [Ignavibacteria bacterium]|nr:M15 family metallopeptidase [Ignavibacteria bacterium]
MSFHSHPASIFEKGLGVLPADTVLVRLHEVIPGMLTDVKYATPDNFTKQILYKSDVLFARRFALENLKGAQHDAQVLGLQLKVFDAYRPHSVQKIMWALVPDERYVADPAKGSRHNRGCAFDLTLCDRNGNELEMGTQYDEFTEASSFDFKEISDTAEKNRKLLNSIMTKNGFTVLPSEWWHYDALGWENFSILDL